MSQQEQLHYLCLLIFIPGHDVFFMVNNGGTIFNLGMASLCHISIWAVNLGSQSGQSIWAAHLGQAEDGVGSQ